MKKITFDAQNSRCQTSDAEEHTCHECGECRQTQTMTPAEMRQLRRLQTERRPEACLGCGLEHNCFVYGHGCAIIRKALRLLGGGADACL